MLILPFRAENALQLSSGWDKGYGANMAKIKTRSKNNLKFLTE
ncbi:hypothetical protein HMPREF1986_00423 [Oribacterium sp. oral taxon 078 str. F0263]|nr:hypothetical protein HMPREF1986_00423 [Oribacterium sp. oral taxon 078 str. F0263]